MTYDLIVVGAGLTGLTAAYRCAQAGKNVLVLEARERVGGRTYTITTQDAGGTINHFDYGAHFIGDESFQAPVWDLVNELGLETFKQYEGPEDVVPTPEKFWAGEGANLQGFGFDEGAKPTIDAYIGTTVPPSDAGRAYIVYLEQLSQSVWLSDPKKTANAEGLDKMSVWDWVCTINMPGYGDPVEPPNWTGETYGNAPNTFRALTRMLCRVGFSTEPENISMLWLLFYVKSSGGLARFQSLRWPIQGAQGYRLKEGAQAIANTLATRLQAMPQCTVMAQTQIVNVTDGANGVTLVDTNGTSYSAGKALIAMAPALNSKMTFQPPLPPARQMAQAAMANSHMIMTFVTFDTTFWRSDTTRYPSGSVNGLPIDSNISEYGLSGDALMADGDVVWVMDNTSDEGQAALFAFIVGDAAIKLADKTKEERQAVVLKTMSTLFGEENVTSNNPVYYEMDWNQQEFSMGCPAGHFLPGQFLKCADGVLLSRMTDNPTGNLYFASTEAATLSNGYMSGAVWSGEQVSKDILGALGQPVARPYDPMAREMAMRDCVNQIMSAIENQIPMLEWPALTPDCVFKGPGGTTLPTAPAGQEGYIGQQGTIEFYTRMGFFFTLSKVRVISISANPNSNSAFCAFLVDGVVNTTGQPFQSIYGTMIFEFTDPSEGAPLIKADRLVMDSTLIDNLVNPSLPPSANPADTQADTQALLDTLKQRAEGLGAWLQGGSQEDLGSGFERTVVYGVGGKTLPSGPFYGVDGMQQAFRSVVDGRLFQSIQLQSMALDETKLTLMVLYEVSGVSASTQTPFTTQLVCRQRIVRDPDLRVAEFSVSMDGTLLD